MVIFVSLLLPCVGFMLCLSWVLWTNRPVAGIRPPTLSWGEPLPKRVHRVLSIVMLILTAAVIVIGYFGTLVVARRGLQAVFDGLLSMLLG